jgi:hypothetical protein
MHTAPDAAVAGDLSLRQYEAAPTGPRRRLDHDFGPGEAECGSLLLPALGRWVSGPLGAMVPLGR